MDSLTPITDHLATRQRSIDFAAFGMLLPNPDPILRAQGKSITTYRDMLTDPLIGGSVRRRRSALKALEWGLDRGCAASRLTKFVQAMLDRLELGRIVSQMQECTLYGYQPMEVMWTKVGGQLLPVDVLAKPPEWFCFDADNQLRLKTKVAPMLGELLPERKILLPRQDPTYQNPYGFADLSMCLWPLVFKKGGLKFWLGFAEKFGSAFSVGKLPRSATNEERATLLDSLDALVQNGTAVIPDDGSVELLEMAGKAASADLYERLVMHCRGEISIALLGQNQTTESSANKASSVAGQEVTKDLRDGDADIVASAVNQLIRWACELNFGDVDVPVFSFWDQAAQDDLKAKRDKSNYDAGARFTPAYWLRAYPYQEGDLEVTAPVASVNGAPTLPSDNKAAAFAEAPAVDPTAALTKTLTATTAPAWTGMADQVQVLVDKATSFNQLQDAMLQAYGGLDSSDLVKLMAAAFALAELKGLSDVQDGN